MLQNLGFINMLIVMGLSIQMREHVFPHQYSASIGKAKCCFTFYCLPGHEDVSRELVSILIAGAEVYIHVGGVHYVIVFCGD